MEESNRHQLMKNRVCERLESEGWNVRQEVPIPTDVKYHHHDFLVDVLARKDGRELAVELGQLKGRDIDDVREHVDEAHHIEYQNTMSVGVEGDLHRVLSTVVKGSTDRSIKAVVSDAILDHLQGMDDAAVELALQKYGYDSLDELEAVVNGEALPRVARNYMDERLAEIA